ncbi:hypothetical protein Chor_005195 [Crotalus horridus]
MTMMGDASEMLAAALEQMDGIIAGSKALEYSNGLFDCQSPTSPFMGSLRVLHLVEDLRGLLEMMEIDEKEGLRCQVPDSTAEILMEWLQNQMINGHLSANGDVYQERLTRLESDKESLVLQVSVLTDQVDAQGEKIRDLELCLEENREKLNATEEMLQQDLMQEVNDLRLKVEDMDRERLQYEKKLKSTKSLMAKLSSMKIKVGQMQYEKQRMEQKCQMLKSYSCVVDVEVQKMKKAVESLLAANEEKTSIQLHTSVLQVSLPSFSQSFRHSEEQTDKGNNPSKIEIACENSEKHPAVVSIETQLSDTKISALQKSSSLGNLKKESSEDKESRDKQEENKSPVENSKYVTLPCKSPAEEDAFGSRKARSSFGRGFFKIKSNKRTASAPNLGKTLEAQCDGLIETCFYLIAETEKESPDHLDLAGFPCQPKGAEGGPLTPPSPDSKKKARGIKKLLRRSQSTTFNPDDMTETEFKRGGTRATAGPRLGWSRDLGQSNKELCSTAAALACGVILQFLLLGVICPHTIWSLHELGIKHPLHRKKLQLALQALGSEEENNHGKLDYNWVTRWLDDIGLPQYKTQFDEGKDDLLSLKVLSVLHHLSIKRAIQVLRINNFEPNCLRRRPSDENNITPSEVSQWTNHRVMEWLRSVDLAEYAPNLRGSGVHGGLMVLEPRFNVETLAQLLNIPPNKTLLRRHLATHFNLLIGSKAQQEKCEAMEAPDYVLLTATAKVKPKKLPFSNFGNLRKKKQEDGEEYVCPMDLGQVAGPGSKKGFKAGLDVRMYDDDDLDRLEQMEDSEGTVRQIGAFSEGINNLTHMLKEDDMFRDLATCSPSASITDEDSNV